MTDRAQRFLKHGATLLTGFMFAYFGIASFGAGDQLGPFIAFVGMLVWANTQRELEFMNSLAQKCIKGWGVAQDKWQECLSVIQRLQETLK
jgi:hypothetical protein